MPVVILKQGGINKIPDIKLAHIIANIPTIVADALDVESDPNARLTPKDIEVWHLSPSLFDRNTKSLTLLIMAHGYEKRVHNLEERKDLIVKKIQSFLDAKKEVIGWVWIFTGETAFGQL